MDERRRQALYGIIMQSAFNTFVKIVIVIAIYVLVYEYLDQGNNPTDLSEAETNPIAASIDRLEEILRSSAQDEKTKEDISREFETFSEKAAEGEIPPAELEDLALAVLDARMQDTKERSMKIEEIIGSMQAARSDEKFRRGTTEFEKEQMDSLAVKIQALAEFQEKHLGSLQKIQISIPSLDVGETEVSVIERIGSPESPEYALVPDFEPVIPEPVEPARRSEERRDKLVITQTGESEVFITLKKGLVLEIDSTLFKRVDSLRAARMLKDLEKLEKLKLLMAKPAVSEKEDK